MQHIHASSLHLVMPTSGQASQFVSGGHVEVPKVGSETGLGILRRPDILNIDVQLGVRLPGGRVGVLKVGHENVGA